MTFKQAAKILSSFNFDKKLTDYINILVQFEPLYYLGDVFRIGIRTIYKQGKFNPRLITDVDFSTYKKEEWFDWMVDHANTYAIDFGKPSRGIRNIQIFFTSAEHERNYEVEFSDNGVELLDHLSGTTSDVNRTHYKFSAKEERKIHGAADVVKMSKRVFINNSGNTMSPAYTNREGFEGCFRGSQDMPEDFLDEC